MKKTKILILIIVLAIISISTYAYYRNQSVETVPDRATLVMHECEKMKRGIAK